jgi:hypothetical protein
MTFRGQSTRATNRVLTGLVLITILVVALWAINGGLDQIPVIETETDTVTVAD